MSRFIHRLSLGFLALVALAGCSALEYKPQSVYPRHPDPMQSAIREATGREREDAARRAANYHQSPLPAGFTPLH